MTEGNAATPGDLLWTPSPEVVERSNLTAYARRLESERGLDFGGDYAAMWRWSIDELEDFWATIWDVLRGPGVDALRPRPGRPDDARGALVRGRGAQLRREPARRPRRTSCSRSRHASELRELSALTTGELRSQVARLAAAMRALGVGRGDRVAAYMPNIPEAIVAFLATASIGAIWSSCSPDFGASSVVDRFAQIEPKLLFCVDGYRYNGRDFDRRDVVAGLLAEMPTVEHTVVLGYLDPEPDLAALRGAVAWDDLLDSAPDAELAFEQVPFDHPLWVLYSSGTTGLPKAIVQGHGGILLEQLKHHHLHLDAQPRRPDLLVHDDRLDDVELPRRRPAHRGLGRAVRRQPGPSGHGRAVGPRRERRRHLLRRLSASYVAACMKAGVEPAAGRDLSALRSVGSTGSPLAPEGFGWIYEHVGADTWLFSTSGGTDVCTAFVGGVPTLPVYAGELQGALPRRRDRGLGRGRQRRSIDEVGELVITEPMPSMPVFLWGDEDGSRYRASYFEMFPGHLAPRRLDRDHLARHGDHLRALRLDHQPLGRAHGHRRDLPGRRRAWTRSWTRSSSTSREPGPRAGCRCSWCSRADAAARRRRSSPSSRRRIRERCSPRHVPDASIEIAEVPRTLSGKVLEVPVKRILSGTPADRRPSRDSLANPAALDYFVELARSSRSVRRPGRDSRPGRRPAASAYGVGSAESADQMSVLPNVGGQSVGGAGASGSGCLLLAALVDLTELAGTALIEDVLAESR